MNDILKEDLAYIHKNLDFSAFAGKKILITGASGLIGSAIVFALLSWNRQHEEKIHVIALARNQAKCEALFSEYLTDGLEILISDVCNLPISDMGLDYIIHGASQTSSRGFVETPVETIMTALDGTRNLLKLAQINHVKGFVYLSSMEIYGTPATDEKIDETHPSNLDVLQVRSCYPESKRMCENLCVSYASEYDVPAKIVRLTQTFGTGVVYNDGRVFAEFARCVLEKRNIILKTKGETKRCYLYTADAVTAILTVLLNGEPGQAYNAANEETYCSIFEMACTVANISKDNIQVVIEENTDIQKLGYAPTLKMNLSTEKLKSLGWVPHYGLTAMYERMMKSMI